MPGNNNHEIKRRHYLKEHEKHLIKENPITRANNRFLESETRLLTQKYATIGPAEALEEDFNKSDAFTAKITNQNIIVATV